MAICWLNGRFVPEEQAQVSIFDRGLLFGDGVYEVAAVCNGRLLDADRHLVRLERSLAEIEMPSPQSREAWMALMQSLVEQNGIDEGLVYLQVTRGVAERDFAFPAVVTPTCFAYARKKRLTQDPNAGGIVLHAVPDIRWARRDIKSTAMLAQVLAKQAAKAAGAYEAVMHERGMITEGGSSTLWIVQHGTVLTRPLSHAILAGITRDVTLELAAREGIPVLERAFALEDAREADECFITSATSFVLPVVRIDDAVIGSGAPGPVSMRLREAYLARAATLTLHR
ncbi:MAG: D-amino acid aminotransferase [Gemmatimonadaceae bacterium]|nr:D-amino acid aminotransferase [Gemmatimonadaceae bacterium]